MPENKDSSIWNLPFEKEIRTARSPASFLPVLQTHFLERPIRVLEIGVFQGGFAKRLYDSCLNVVSYDGIDPFSGKTDDPYANSEHYWMDESEADETYGKTRALLQSLGYQIHRQTSLAFFSSELASNKTFDLIHVDGDHRYHQALFDMRVCFAALVDGGILAIDDYANADTPDVTWAFDAFHQENQLDIRRIGYTSNWFQSESKPAPMSQATVYLEPVPLVERKNQRTVSEIIEDMYGNVTKPPPWTSKLLDLSPRKVLRCIFGK